WESEYILFPKEVTAAPHIIRAFIQAIAPEGATKLVALQIARVIKPQRSDLNSWQDIGTLPVSGVRRGRGTLSVVSAAINPEASASRKSLNVCGLKLVRLAPTASSNSTNS